MPGVDGNKNQTKGQKKTNGRAAWDETKNNEKIPVTSMENSQEVKQTNEKKEEWIKERQAGLNDGK
jgi:hypothetical protein